MYNRSHITIIFTRAISNFIAPFICKVGNSINPIIQALSNKKMYIEHYQPYQAMKTLAVIIQSSSRAYISRTTYTVPKLTQPTASHSLPDGLLPLRSLWRNLICGIRPPQSDPYVLCTEPHCEILHIHFGEFAQRGASIQP